MSSTKKIISEQVLFRLAGGYPDVSNPVDERDIWKAIEQKVNSYLKLSQFNQNLPSGETIPDNLMIATYEDVELTRTSNQRCKATLPVMPVSLPSNLGIYEIRPVLNLTDSGERILGNPLIPLQAGQDYLLSADKLLNDLMGQIGYTPNGKTVVLTKDITTFNISKVDMQLVVFDMSQYGITDILPIPADYEEQLINDLVATFAPVPSESGEVNQYTNIGQLPQNAPKR